MHFIIHCLDAADAGDKRQANYADHRAYLAAAPVRIVVSGPLVADDGETMIGSCLLVEADSRAEVEDFNRGDPFNQQGVWETVSIHAFLKRVDNR